MIKRTIEVSNPAYLKLNNKQLEIHQTDKSTGSIPIEDIGVLLLAHSQITITQRLLVELGKNNVVVVNCDQKYLPISLVLAMHSHTTHTKVLRTQTAISTVRQKQLWKMIVQTKISEQATTLRYIDSNHKPVSGLISSVKAGDKTNIEAQAARRYWRLMFGDNFRRNIESSCINMLLNYGYAVIRAMIARALVGAGFHPAIGLNHHNQYNAYCLADDVMEPFRPWVDEVVAQLVMKGYDSVCSESKKELLGILDKTVSYDGENTPLMVATGLLAAKLKAAYTDTSIKLQYPKRMASLA